MLTCQPRFSEASELCQFSVVEPGPMMTDNCQLRPIRKHSKYRVWSKKTNLLSILACRSCNNVGSTLYSLSVSIFITPDSVYPCCSDWLPPWPSRAAAKKRLRNTEDKEKLSVRPHDIRSCFFKEEVEVEQNFLKRYDFEWGELAMTSCFRESSDILQWPQWLGLLWRGSQQSTWIKI